MPVPIQSNHAESVASGTKIGVTLAGVTAGSSIICDGTGADNVGITNITDGTTVFANDITRDGTNEGQNMTIRSLWNSPGGSRTFTMNYAGAGAASNRGIQAYEMPGLQQAASGTGCKLSGTPTGNDSGAGTASSFDSSGTSTITTTVPAWVVSYGEGDAHLPTAAGAFTGGIGETVNNCATEYLTQGAAGAVNPNFSMSAADKWNLVTAAYAVASTGLAGIDDGGPQRQAPDIQPRRLPGIDAPPAGFSPRGLLDQSVPRARPPYQPLGRNRGASESPSPFSPRGLLEERPPVLGRARTIPTKLVPDAGAPLPPVVNHGLGDANLQRPAASPDRPFPAGGVDQPIGFPPVGMLDVSVARPPLAPRAFRPSSAPEAVPAPQVTSALLDDGGVDLPARPPRVTARGTGAEAIPAPPIAPALPPDELPRVPRPPRAAARAPIAETGPREPLTFGDDPMPRPTSARRATVIPPAADGAPLPQLAAFADVLVRARSRLARWLPRLFGDDGWLTAFIPLPKLKQPTTVLVAPFATQATPAPCATTAQVAPFATTVVVPASPTRTTTTAGDQPSTVQLDT